MTASSPKQRCYKMVAVTKKRRNLARIRVNRYKKWVQKDAQITQKYRPVSTDSELTELRRVNPMPDLPLNDDWGIADGTITEQRREIRCGAIS